MRGVPANEQARRPRRVRRRKRRGSSPSPPSPRRGSGREGAWPRHATPAVRLGAHDVPVPGQIGGGIKSRRLQILRRHGSAFSPVRASRELRTGPANHWALWGPSRGVQVQAPSTIKAGRALCIAVAYGGDHPTTADGSGWLQLNWYYVQCHSGRVAAARAARQLVVPARTFHCTLGAWGGAVSSISSNLSRSTYRHGLCRSSRQFCSLHWHTVHCSIGGAIVNLH